MCRFAIVVVGIRLWFFYMGEWATASTHLVMAAYSDVVNCAIANLIETI